jgi:hypothetical protein
VQFLRKLFERPVALANRELGEQLGGALHDYERAAPTLRVLLYTPTDAAPFVGKLIAAEDLPGLSTVVMFDMPTTFGNVRPEYSELWKVPKGDILRRALANSVREPTVVEQVQVAPGVHVTSIAGDHPWVCANALAIENHLGLLSPYGALLAVPHRQHVLAHAIRDCSAGTALGVMIQMVHRILGEGPPKPISKDIFWYRSGTYARIGATVVGAMPVQLHPDNSDFLRDVARPLGFAPP